MPARLLPADKLTHAWIGFFITLPGLPGHWLIALAVCLVAAVGREVYGWHQRGRTMTVDNWKESALDVGATMAGGFLAAIAFTLGSKA